ncbi:MAG: hypothetical protein L3K01_01695 [Thermoplasmata archaeon]|nr:hypothetical protein [Thermoplasmata archaeon]
MTDSAPAWPHKALRILVPVTGLLLVAQYLLGLWTNAYAPASGFTSNSSFPSLDWHYNIGFALGILGLLVVIVAAFTRKVPFIGLAIVLFVGIAIAGVEGMRFVNSTPNPPVDAVLMGVGFLVAFWASLALGWFALGMGRIGMHAPGPGSVST